MRAFPAMLALATALAPLSAAGAQQWRTLETARQITGDEPISVEVGFAAGKMTLRRVGGPLLYQMKMRYDEQTTDASHAFDADRRHLELGMRSAHVGIRQIVRMGSSSDDRRHGSLDVGLTDAVPMKLSVKLGAGEGHLELGALRLRALDVKLGGADAHLAFDEPNRETMERMEIDVAGASAEVEGLGHANVKLIAIKGAAGSIELDFGDQLSSDVTIDADLALGELRIVLPRGVGVTLRSRETLSEVEASGLSRIGDAWYSENWNDASRKITINAKTVLASFSLDRTGR